MTRALTGRGVLLWLIGFFAVIAVVDGGFIAASIGTFRGEDEQKPYLQGVEYNHTLARRAEQSRLGWHAYISAQRLASGTIRVAVTLSDASGHPAAVRLTGELRHPADENRDVPLHFAAAGPGRYTAEGGRIGAGAWDVVVATAAGEAPFEASRRVWAP